MSSKGFQAKVPRRRIPCERFHTNGKGSSFQVKVPGEGLKAKDPSTKRFQAKGFKSRIGFQVKGSE